MSKHEFNTLMLFLISHATKSYEWNKKYLDKDIPNPLTLEINPNSKVKVSLGITVEFMKNFLSTEDRKELFPDE